MEGNDVIKADRKVFRDTLVQKLTKSLTDMSEDKKIDAMRKVLQLHGSFLVIDLRLYSENFDFLKAFNRI